MKKQKGFLFGILLLGLLTLGTFYDANEVDASSWQPRSVEQIKNDIDGADQYTVREGDTLSAIAEALGLDINQLASANNIQDINVVKVGDILTTKITYVVNQTPISVNSYADTSAGNSNQEYYYTDPNPDIHYETPAVEGNGEPTDPIDVAFDDVTPIPLPEPVFEGNNDEAPIEDPNESVVHDLPPVDKTE
ncbi:LysM peptidoglycan-binding domain-containing protein [Candidatus Enterococcus murrayae]|uniref:LysM peptidoglycan-binding domain-containing protein n=1 Tax=Candidatus Enterococcus murrayae TaxID=2815321 RepID=A0ABS3HJW7_9ENTE|nr:LysM domain-containing protein [Enterococcus sp. MJM16]MBO0453740.1 LysM peptidoglycan-binding domain-containing protein [Enterococcus sp. MJM16]